MPRRIVLLLLALVVATIALSCSSESTNTEPAPCSEPGTDCFACCNEAAGGGAYVSFVTAAKTCACQAAEKCSGPCAELCSTETWDGDCMSCVRDGWMDGCLDKECAGGCAKYRDCWVPCH